MEKLNFIISKNLTELRKQHKLTQLEVAEKLNYSDKTVSKWEQGESLPGIEILHKLSKLYDVSMDYLVEENHSKSENTNSLTKRRHTTITLLSILAIWFIATVIYVSADIFVGAGIPWLMVFCWAVPASFVVAIVFDALWHNRKFLFVLISLLIWSFLLCFCIQFVNYGIWTLLGVGIPLQLATILSKKLVK